MNLDQSELYDSVTAWLANMGYQPVLRGEQEGLFFWLDTKRRQSRCRILVEARERPPLTIHFFARLQLLVPQHRLAIVALHLMNLNRGIRFGSFILASDAGIVSYRFTHLLAGDQRLNHQYDFCLRQALWYAEEYTPKLRAFISNPADFEDEIIRWKTFREDSAE